MIEPDKLPAGSENSSILPPPRVMALHDLSCFGRCALTVILPTLSALGFQVVPIPTALLSTHTGGFEELFFRDLTDDMEKISAHFERIGARFRAIYPGFLGSEKQIDTVLSIIGRFSALPDESGQKPLVFVDPVMGDDGVLYSTYTPALMEGMKKICARADVLTPNLTEACFLTGIPFPSRNASDDELLLLSDRLLDALEAFGPSRIVITGIPLSDDRIGNRGETLSENPDGAVSRSRFLIAARSAGCSYPGTGDLFASVLLGELLRGIDFEDAVKTASDFTAAAIRESVKVPSPTRNGVSLEPLLGSFSEQIGKGGCD